MPPFFWAKLSRNPGTPTFHPLTCHLLDVAATAEAMWDTVLPSCVRLDLANGLGLPVEHARAWVSFLAGAHDIGKLSPAFQLRSEAGVLAEQCRAWGGSGGNRAGPTRQRQHAGSFVHSHGAAVRLFRVGR